MAAVWELTKNSSTKYATCSEIASEIQRIFGGSLPAMSYIRRTIKEMQKPHLDYNTFDEDHEPAPPGTFKNTPKTFRLGYTVILWDTAQLLLDLAKKVENHRLSPPVVQLVMNEACEKYNFKPKNVNKKLLQFIKSKYIEETPNGDFHITNRFAREEEYIDYVANKFICDLSKQTIQNNSQAKPTRKKQDR